ncbi:MAG: 50S ribosomal protein L10 [Gammaproteobacteria bacterium]
MALKLEQKQAVVAQVAEVAARAHSAVAAEYAGLSVADLTELRRAARANGVHLQVVRNTLARRALENTSLACMRDGLSGPLVLAFATAEPGAAARVIRDFARIHTKLVVRVVALGGKLVDPKAIDSVASLPTRDEALARLLGVMKAPIEKLARTIAEPHAKLVRTIAAVRDQNQQAA